MNRIDAIREIEAMIAKERNSFKSSTLAPKETGHDVSMFNLAVRRRVEALEAAVEALRQ